MPSCPTARWSPPVLHPLAMQLTLVGARMLSMTTLKRHPIVARCRQRAPTADSVQGQEDENRSLDHVSAGVAAVPPQRESPENAGAKAERRTRPGWVHCSQPPLRATTASSPPQGIQAVCQRAIGLSRLCCQLWLRNLLLPQRVASTIMDGEISGHGHDAAAGRPSKKTNLASMGCLLDPWPCSPSASRAEARWAPWQAPLPHATRSPGWW